MIENNIPGLYYFFVGDQIEFQREVGRLEVLGELLIKARKGK